MNDNRFDVVIVGGGHAGAQAAIALRQRKFEGSVAIVTNESDLPYERPPLSKDYLCGEKSFENILIRPERFWTEREIRLLTDRHVCTVDPAAHRVSTSEDETIEYGKLIWAAGGTPRRLSCEGADLAGVHAIRNRSDVDRLLNEMPATQRVCVIGGGYIGLEAAAILTKLGKSVTVLEAQDRVLARVAGVELSRFYERVHRSHGVDIRLSASVDCLVGENGAVTGVRLADGATLPCEIVVVGIGIMPSVDPLLRAGARGAHGIDVDEFCRTSLEDIYAIGDCAAHLNRFAQGARLRVESVQNANDMAVVAARSITGDAIPYDAVPWFWSNQYDLRLQTVGLSLGHDQTVMRGDNSTRSFSVIYLRAGRVIALDCVNATKDYVTGRNLVVSGIITDPADLANPDLPLKTLAQAAPVAAADRALSGSVNLRSI